MIVGGNKYRGSRHCSGGRRRADVEVVGRVEGPRSRDVAVMCAIC
jgi:hypothetical protein